MRRGDTATVVVAAMLAVSMSSTLGLVYAAQPPTSVSLSYASGPPGFPRLTHAVQPQKSIHDGVFTADQVEGGRKVWDNVCSECHPMDIFGPDYMIGWEGATAGELFEQIQATMPYESPGILPANEYLEVMVFLFSLNGVKPGEEELPLDTAQLHGITIDGPFEWAGGGR